MIVSELEEMLAYLPGDLAVCIDGGRGACHVRALDKVQRYNRNRYPADRALPRLAVEDADGRTPPALILRSAHGLDLRPVIWHDAYADDVAWVATGRWPARPIR